MGQGWNPWQSLRAWGDRIELLWAELPDDHHGGLSYPLGGRIVIELDHRLDRVERRAVVGHELIHCERHIFYSPDAPALLVAKEEEAVERELTQRLVPLDALACLVAARVTVGAVTASMVAVEFDVPDRVARRACWALARQQGLPM